jgi:hypothetical protein
VPRNTSGLKRGGPGRPKGKPNKATEEVKALAASFVDDPDYRKKLLGDWKKRKVHPSIEAMIWHYAKGKPKDSLEITGDSMRPLIIDRVSTRAEMLEALGDADTDAGDDDD